MPRARPHLFLLVSLFAVVGCGASREGAWQTTSPTSSVWPASPTPPSRSAGYCSADYQAQFGWPDPEVAARICRCESGGNPRAVSRNHLYMGLFQFARATWQSLGGGDPFDPATNSEHAYRLWRQRGFRPWPTCGR